MAAAAQAKPSAPSADPVAEPLEENGSASKLCPACSPSRSPSPTSPSRSRSAGTRPHRRHAWTVGKTSPAVNDELIAWSEFEVVNTNWPCA